jgi:decaprenyl-phosphate phosphoribosyltransferase
VTMSYCLWLKHEPVLDIAAVAAGFVLRAVAGGAAAQVPISNWFFIVVSFGALFMVAGKRHGENLELGTRSGEHRSTLAAYSDSFLRYVRGTCSAVAIAAYCLWASDRAGGGHAGLSWFEISIVPFVLAIFRYGLVVERGEAAAPEEVVLGDRVLQVLALLWVAVFALGVYLR